MIQKDNYKNNNGFYNLFKDDSLLPVILVNLEPKDIFKLQKVNKEIYAYIQKYFPLVVDITYNNIDKIYNEKAFQLYNVKLLPQEDIAKIFKIDICSENKLYVAYKIFKNLNLVIYSIESRITKSYLSEEKVVQLLSNVDNSCSYSFSVNYIKIDDEYKKQIQLEEKLGNYNQVKNTLKMISSTKEWARDMSYRCTFCDLLQAKDYDSAGKTINLISENGSYVRNESYRDLCYALIKNKDYDGAGKITKKTSVDLWPSNHLDNLRMLLLNNFDDHIQLGKSLVYSDFDVVKMNFIKISELLKLDKIICGVLDSSRNATPLDPLYSLYSSACAARIKVKDFKGAKEFAELPAGVSNDFQMELLEEILRAQIVIVEDYEEIIETGTLLSEKYQLKKKEILSSTGEFSTNDIATIEFTEIVNRISHPHKRADFLYAERAYLDFKHTSCVVESLLKKDFDDAIMNINYIDDTFLCDQLLIKICNALLDENCVGKADELVELISEDNQFKIKDRIYSLSEKICEKYIKEKDFVSAFNTVKLTREGIQKDLYIKIYYGEIDNGDMERAMKTLKTFIESLESTNIFLHSDIDCCVRYLLKGYIEKDDLLIAASFVKYLPIKEQDKMYETLSRKFLEKKNFIEAIELAHSIFNNESRNNLFKDTYNVQVKVDPEGAKEVKKLIQTSYCVIS